MVNESIINWLLEGDVSIQYQTHRDLLHSNKPQLQSRIEREGWGNAFLSQRQPNGHWGRGFYMPKWTSTHYTLLDLKNLAISPKNKVIRQSLHMVLKEHKAPDGGIQLSTNVLSDLCVNGMVLNYASYFQVKETLLQSIVDNILSQRMSDGGFNCRSNHGSPHHSSLHTTLSVLEGILEYQNNGYDYRLKELIQAKESSQEFILMHRLFRSDKTGRVIKDAFLKLCYPGRWYYDILKALDYFQFAKCSYDSRMDDALEFVLSKCGNDGRWKLPSKHAGQVHFNMEQSAKPSRWNTLRALRVLQQYG